MLVKHDLPIQELAEGKVQQAFSKELELIVQDILDPTKDPTEERTIDIKLKIKANEEARYFQMSATTKSKLGTRDAGVSRVGIEKESNQINLFEILDGDIGE